MSSPPYPYRRLQSTRYVFLSVGKSSIQKVVEFSPTPVKDVYNMGFGDVLPDGNISDRANSNNGDIVKVMATVIQILKEFTASHKHIKIYFTGSTPERIVLYRRILKTYYKIFSKEFIISALVERENKYQEVLFDMDSQEEYHAFFIKRIL
ncbi:MAG: hypothetical protein KF862_04005 [Chitinophagaceae bacterium]|nr:hypothetical protein [Chitinophagaceae bacterium]